MNFKALRYFPDVFRFIETEYFLLHVFTNFEGERSDHRITEL